MTFYRTPIAVAGLLASLGVGACGATGAESISADTTCESYLQQPGPDRQDAAIRISTEIEGVASAGNPMWAMSLDAACGSSPSMTIGEYFDPNK